MRKLNVQKLKQKYFRENPETNGPKFAIAILLEESTREGEKISFRRFNRMVKITKKVFPQYMKEIDAFAEEIKKNKGVVWDPFFFAFF